MQAYLIKELLLILVIGWKNIQENQLGNKYWFMYVDQKDIGNEALMRMSDFLIKHHSLWLLHKSLGALTFQTHHDIGKGTAVLISRNLILTCAHNIYDKERGYAYKDFKFYLAVHGDSSDYYEIETYRFMEKQFAKCESRQRLRFEFALMKLKDDIEKPIKITHFLKLDLLCHQCQASKFKLSIYGYSSHCSYQQQPVETQQGVEGGMALNIYQYGLTKKGRLKEINLQEQSLKYQMTTHPGQSGCPVVSNNIIAIHVGGGAGKSDYNIGRMVTPEMVDIMREWIFEMQAEGFELHQHCHEVRYENKKLIIQKGQGKQKIVLEYNQHKHLTVQKILNQYFKEVNRYQCLMYKSTVLLPQDMLDKIQQEPLFSNQQIILQFLKGSERFYFYRVVLKQYQDSSICDYNQLMTIPSKETHKNAYIRKVVDFYSKYYFYQMNKTLRACDFSPKSEMLQMATELIHACSLLPKSFCTQVYRGVSKDYQNSLQQGQLVQFGEFLSTSKVYQEAYKHTLRTHEATLFKFKSTNGTVLGDNYACAGKEVIIHLPFSNFIVERTFRRDEISYADLVQIAGPITYRKDLIVWICNRSEMCEKEWSNWIQSGQIQIIHVPSVKFFRDAWLPVYGWLLKWKQIRVRILLYEKSENLWDSLRSSLSKRLSRQQSLEEMNLGLMELLEQLRWKRDDWTEVLFYTDNPKKHAKEAIQRGLYRNFGVTCDVEYVNRFVQFSEQSQEDLSESR